MTPTEQCCLATISPPHGQVVKPVVFPWGDHELSEGTGHAWSMAGSRPNQVGLINFLGQTSGGQTKLCLPITQGPLLNIAWSLKIPDSTRSSYFPPSLWLLLWYFAGKQNSHHNNKPQFLRPSKTPSGSHSWPISYDSMYTLNLRTMKTMSSCNPRRGWGHGDTMSTGV